MFVCGLVNDLLNQFCSKSVVTLSLSKMYYNSFTAYAMVFGETIEMGFIFYTNALLKG